MTDAELTKGQSRQERTGRLQIILVVAVLLAGFAANAVLSNTGTKPRQKAQGGSTLLVEVIQPTIKDTRVSIVETGVIRARNTIALSPQVSGRVIEVSPNLASGGSFKAGETLFRIDPADYLAAVEQMRAEVARVEADLQVEMAEAQVAREEWNLIHPGEPIPDLVARAPQISQREAAVQSAKANLVDAELQLTRVAFSLPFDGRITSTSIEVGQFLNFGQSYGSAYALSSIEIAASINANVMAALDPIVGREAEVRQPNSGFRNSPRYAARIIRADAELDTDTRLAGVVLAFEAPVPLLPGAFIEVEILGPVIPQAHLVPERAISEKRTIWVVENGRLKSRQARFFSAKDGTVVTMPFDYGDGIVTSPLIDPAEGIPVSIVSAKDGAA